MAESSRQVPGSSSCPPHDPIRIFAPSGPFDREAFDQGVRRVRARGRSVDWDPDIFQAQGFLAGSDEGRGSLLRALLAEEEPVVLWAARGGHGAARIAQSLALGPAPKTPRWLVGFSDVTVLHMLWRRWGWVSLHGANMTTWGRWGDAQRAALWAQLEGAGGTDLEGSALCGPRETVSGPLLGGNLTVLASMVGNGWLPSFEGAIILLEDINEQPYQLDRSLTQLLNGGLLDGVAGIAVGQLTNCAQPAALDVFRERLERLAVPVVAGFPVGHDDDSWSVLHGWEAELDGASGRLFQHPKEE